MRPHLFLMIPLVAAADPEIRRDLEKPSVLSVTVDRSARRLSVRIGGRPVASYVVTVGKPDHRTPLGTYRLSHVVWNPKWIPPQSEWADTAESKAPGEQGNPMGRVKIQFDSLLYIHGTTATGSLGEPASHGCVRMRNADAMRLARLVMEHGGAQQTTRWYSAVRSKPTESFEVAIPHPPVLRVVP
jgi:lipoprotein-anchoring transpeptidase ErfK/SrfK